MVSGDWDEHELRAEVKRLRALLAEAHDFINFSPHCPNRDALVARIRKEIGA